MSAYAHHHRDCIAVPVPRREVLGTRSLGGLLRVWAMRWRTRRDLAGLDRRLLADIGVDPIRASLEAEKPFWKA